MIKMKGYLLMAAIVILVIFGIISGIIVSVAILTATGTTYLDRIKAASFLAESGLQAGRRALTEPVLTDRQTCAAYNNTTAFTEGAYTVSKASDAFNTINPRENAALLATAFSDTDTITSLNIDNAAGFYLLGGRVMIDQEAFNYLLILGNTMLGVTRAQDGTRPADHIVGAIVSQYQCVLTSTGVAPQTNPKASRSLQMGLQMPMAYSVGDGGVILRWNGPNSEKLWSSQSPGSFSFNAISLLNYHSGWAVADSGSSSLTRVSRLEGTTWTNVSISISQSSDLFGVDAVSSSEAWAVGDRTSNNNLAILMWRRNASNSASNWCRLPCNNKTVSGSGISNAEKYLYAIKMYNSNGGQFATVGYAVGGDTSGSNSTGLIMSFNGTSWSELALPSPNTNRIGRLFGLDIVPNGNNNPKDIYFVGRSAANTTDGKILRLRNGVWTVRTTTGQLMAVSPVDSNGDGLADYVIAVGLNGRVITFDGNLNQTSSLALSGSPDLYAVSAKTTNSAWAVGEAGARWYYNGTSWISTPGGVSSSVILRGDSFIAPTDPISLPWYEIIN
jgi:hypothetical protein